MTANEIIERKEIVKLVFPAKHYDISDNNHWIIKIVQDIDNLLNFYKIIVFFRHSDLPEVKQMEITRINCSMYEISENSISEMEELKEVINYLDYVRKEYFKDSI